MIGRSGANSPIEHQARSSGLVRMSEGFRGGTVTYPAAWEPRAPAELSLLGGEVHLANVPTSIVGEYGVGARVLGAWVCGESVPYGGIKDVPPGLVDLDSAFRVTGPLPASDQEMS